jgi:hypothetical protein
MALFEMHCQYCGHRWQYSLYFTPKEKQIRCNVCNDPNVKFKSIENTAKDKDVFGYNVKKED